MLEDLSFEAPSMPNASCGYTPQYVDDKLKSISTNKRFKCIYFINIYRRRKIMSLLSKTRELNTLLQNIKVLQ